MSGVKVESLFSVVDMTHACRTQSRAEILRLLRVLADCENGQLEDWSRPFTPLPSYVTGVIWRVDEKEMDKELASALKAAFPMLNMVNLIPSEPTAEQKEEARREWGFEIE